MIIMIKTVRLSYNTVMRHNDAEYVSGAFKNIYLIIFKTTCLSVEPDSNY